MSKKRTGRYFFGKFDPKKMGSWQELPPLKMTRKARKRVMEEYAAMSKEDQDLGIFRLLKYAKGTKR